MDIRKVREIVDVMYWSFDWYGNNFTKGDIKVFRLFLKRLVKEVEK